MVSTLMTIMAVPIFIPCLSTRFTLLVNFVRNFLLFPIAKNSELLKCTKTFDDTSLGSGLFLLHNFLRQSRRPTLSTRDGSPSQQFSLKILSTWHPHNYWWKLTQDAPPCPQDSRDGSSNQQSPLEYYQLVAIINENSPSAAFKVLKIVLNVIKLSPSLRDVVK